MNCLILGGTGHIGSAIVRELLEFGHRVSIVTRDSKQLWNPDITCLKAKDYATFDYGHAFSGCDYVVDAGAPYPIDSTVAPGIARSAERLMKQKLEIARTAGCAYIYVSSFVTLLERERQRLHPYHLLKKRLEQLVIAELRNGLNARIINAPACFGPYDPKNIELAIIAALADGRVPALIEGVIEYLDVRDLASDIRRGIEQRQFHGPTRVAALSLSIRDLANEVSHQAQVEVPQFVKVPGAIASLGASLAEAGTHFLGMRTTLPALSVNLLLDAMAIHNHSPAPKPVSAFSLQTTIADAIAWYRGVGCLAD